MNTDEAREEAWRTWLGESMPGESGFRFAWDARGRYDEQRIAELEAALDEERAKFQNETLRTSELTQLLLRFAHLHTDRGHAPGAWSRTCIDCELVVEARALISKPINVRALGQSEEVKP